MGKKKRYRSAITGRFVKLATALRWKKVTVAEEIVTPPRDVADDD